jgi:hypothetical protein
MAIARKAFRLAIFEREGQKLIEDISNHEEQLRTARNDARRKELQSSLEIARLELEINGYKIKYENATTKEEKGILLQCINNARRTLNELLRQKRTSGMSFFIFRFLIQQKNSMRLCFSIMCCHSSGGNQSRPRTLPYGQILARRRHHSLPRLLPANH